jgi:hypothetical protein
VSGPHQGPPNPQGVPPKVEARLRDPRHPVHHGLVLKPVPNLIVTRSATPRYGERNLYMSWWMAKTVVFAHYTRMQKLLYFGGVVWLILTFVVGGVLLAQHGDDCRSDIYTNECIED